MQGTRKPIIVTSLGDYKGECNPLWHLRFLKNPMLTRVQPLGVKKRERPCDYL